MACVVEVTWSCLEEGITLLRVKVKGRNGSGK